MFKDENNQLKGINCVILGLFVMVIASTIMTFLANGALALSIKDISNGISDKDIQIINLVALGSGIIVAILNLVLPLVTWHRYLGQKLSQLGFKKIDGKELIKGALFAFLVVGIPYVWCNFFHQSGIVDGRLDLLSVGLILVSSLSSATSIYFTKGYLMGCMRNTNKFWLVLLIPVVVEVVFYNSGLELMALNIMTSLACGLMYMKSDDLSGAIAFRFIFSFLSGVFLLNAYDLYIMIIECVLSALVCLYYYDGKHSLFLRKER